MTQPDKSPAQANTPAEPVSPNPSVEDIDATKGVNDADADRVKGGVKKTMQTQ